MSRLKISAEIKKERKSERNRRYYEEHKDAVRLQHKLWYEKNRETVIPKKREYQAKNVDRYKVIQERANHARKVRNIIMKNFKNTIIAPPSMELRVLNGRYNKEIVISGWIDSTEFYYFSKTGKLRTVRANGIYESIKNSVGCPTGHLRLIRKLK